MMSKPDGEEQLAAEDVFKCFAQVINSISLCDRHSHMAVIHVMEQADNHTV